MTHGPHTLSYCVELFYILNKFEQTEQHFIRAILACHGTNVICALLWGSNSVLYYCQTTTKFRWGSVTAFGSGHTDVILICM